MKQLWDSLLPTTQALIIATFYVVCIVIIARS